jgi:hypothetical protein
MSMHLIIRQSAVFLGALHCLHGIENKDLMQVQIQTERDPMEIYVQDDVGILIK